MRVRGVCECALKLPRVWEGCAAIILHITGCQPDSGKPTVRDERGACGNVGYGRTRHPPRRSKERESETLYLRSYAPYFYPTIEEGVAVEAKLFGLIDQQLNRGLVVQNHLR